MTAPREDGHVHLADYLPPAWRIPRVALVFELDPAQTRVEATLDLVPDPDRPAQALELDGEGLELLEIALDGRPLAPHEYAYDGQRLHVPGARAACRLRTLVRILPAQNTRLEGLYTSGPLLLTQCEAQGFRRITFLADRPDVMPTWQIVLRADRTAFPVLLANGNPAGTRALADGRHEATWENPHPTPGYLFAIAAGPLERVSRTLTTAGGREVELNVWAQGDDVARCGYALGAVERALRWDERRFGRTYDLDVFNVVAAQDFTMGAMENKGLNIFNARYILADEATATDADFLAIESVVAHEYLHNWSGNRVTLRDWFQLSLKEGLTVYRDTEFSSDLHSRALKRIEGVRLLRGRQFAEDAGPLAHAVRPDRYREISNFYTLTVYEKGAELVRVLQQLVGDEAFRAGMDKYFDDNDGRAATLEDFLAAHAAASGRDLSDFARWYAQAGTPEVRVTPHFDPRSGDYTLEIEQSQPATPGQPGPKPPLPIPLRFALYAADGRRIDELPETDAPVRDGLVELQAARHVLRWPALGREPLPAFNQGFSAPVKLQVQYAPEELAKLAGWDTDPFNLWDLLQRLATDALVGAGARATAIAALAGVLAELLEDDDADPAFVAECLQLPDFDTLAEMVPEVDVEALVGAREALADQLARELAPSLEARYHALATAADGGLAAPAMAARALRNACLALLSRLDPACTLAEAAFAQAGTMTERLAALRALLHRGAPGADAALRRFQHEFADDPLVTDKWIALVATRPQAGALADVDALLASDWWKPANPNRVRALLGSFARANPRAFHRADGAGHARIAGQVAALDAVTPQVAARLLGAFEGWRRLAGPARASAATVLAALEGWLESPDTRDLLQRLRAG